MNPAKLLPAPYSYRDDPSVPPFPDDKAVIVFDGHCAMCSGWARTVLRCDRVGRYRLLPAQTPLGRALYVHYGLDSDRYETNILIEQGRAYVKADSSIRMAEGLGFPFNLAKALRLLPRAAADRVYEFIARNRFRVFGRNDRCMMSLPGWEERFLK
jgi:predicted DCC family thiol-disulfide oxidoreductase YuxK